MRRHRALRIAASAVAVLLCTAAMAQDTAISQTVPAAAGAVSPTQSAAAAPVAAAGSSSMPAAMLEQPSSSLLMSLATQSMTAGQAASTSNQPDVPAQSTSATSAVPAQPLQTNTSTDVAQAAPVQNASADDTTAQPVQTGTPAGTMQATPLQLTTPSTPAAGTVAQNASAAGIVTQAPVEPLSSPSTSPDPCSVLPGCLSCTPAGTPTSPSSRKLLDYAGFSMGGLTASGKPTIDYDSIYKSVYDEANAPFCTACNSTGYVNSPKGKCSCLPGYGDTGPTGVCEKCPDGTISQGGFKAVCVECENIAWNNDDNTACLCASGWYGYTNPATKQATCNQCPGTRPVSKDGATTAMDCSACAAGTKPNEIFSECVSATPAPPPPPRTLADLLTPSPSPSPMPNAPALFNSSTFANASKDWQVTSRRTQNVSNPIADLIGDVVQSMVMGKPISSSAQQPGDLIYQVLTKEAPQPQSLNLPVLGELQGANQPLNMASLGILASSVQAGLNALPNLVQAVNSGDGNKLIQAVGDVAKQIAPNMGIVGSPASTGGASGGNSLSGLLSGLSSLFGSAKPAAPANPLAAAAKTLGGFIEVPSVPPRATNTFSVQGVMPGQATKTAASAKPAILNGHKAPTTAAKPAVPIGAKAPTPTKAG